MGFEQYSPIIVPTIVAIVSGLTGYFVTKSKEIGVNMKQKKQERYDDLLTKLFALQSNISKPNIQEQFIESYYKASAYASDEVLKKCYQLLGKLNDKTKVEYVDTEINEIYNAIRQDTEKHSYLFRKPSFDFKAYHIKGGRVLD
jgi:ribosomal 50S subunit-associated protein YjgA (DUF615 family)